MKLKNYGIMARKKEMIIMPHLVDQGGDMKKKWYVEYSVRNSRTGEMKRFREYSGFGKLTSAEARRELGAQIVDRISAQLADGWSPFDAPSATYRDELIMQQVARRWGAEKTEQVSLRVYLSAFLELKQASVSAKTMENYRSKLRIFGEWCERNGVNTLLPASIRQPDIQRFLVDIARRGNLSRLSVGKYEQILHTFWSYLVSERVVVENVVVEIPPIGRVVDCAPRPICERDRARMGKLMLQYDPQLYIVCSLEYYCAIRPGECRQLQVCDVDLENAQIRVPGSKSKNRMTECVKIPSQLLEVFSLMKLNECGQNDYLFSADGRPGAKMVGKNTFRVRFNRLRERAGISKEVKLYSYKHAAASELVNAGVDTWELQRHFRHKSIETTERYLRKKIAKESDLLLNHFPDM